MAADIRLARLTGEALAARLDDIAALRCAVFREWPYLYEGNADYERAYLAKLATGDGLAVAALDGTRIVGVSTAMPLAQEHEAFLKPFRDAGMDVGRFFYLAESVLEPTYRGRGIGVRFFEEREAAARDGGHDRTCFCAVVRPDDHPARPADYRPLDAFWRRRGYEKLPGITTSFPWREIGDEAETEHPMQFWGRSLSAA